MSLYLRLVIGPIVVCDIDLFATAEKRDPDKDLPPQLAGGSGTIHYPDDIPVGEPVVFGFVTPSRTDRQPPNPVAAAKGGSSAEDR